MKTYRVGGCVRDELLGLEPKDIDYVVVGATHEIMVANGFEKVGASFPVYLKDGEEYALARKERKTGVGYNGFDTIFTPDVTLEDDLLRRDLTINSMAKDPDTGAIIDPYGGQKDLEMRVLRHTSAAFMEDPVRVLRVARFAARYGFSIAPETMSLMREIVGELNSVPQERIWAEFQKGLMEPRPDLMILALRRSGALAEPAMHSYRYADMSRLMLVSEVDDLVARFAMIAEGFGTEPETFLDARIPIEVWSFAKSWNEYGDELLNFHRLPASRRVDILQRIRLNEKTINRFIAYMIRFGATPSTWNATADMIFDTETLKSLDYVALVEDANARKVNIGDYLRDAKIAALTRE